MAGTTEVAKEIRKLLMGGSEWFYETISEFTDNEPIPSRITYNLCAIDTVIVELDALTAKPNDPIIRYDDDEQKLMIVYSVGEHFTHVTFEEVA